MLVQLLSAGNLRLRTRNADPTGEKHRTTYTVSLKPHTVGNNNNKNYTIDAQLTMSRLLAGLYRWAKVGWNLRCHACRIQPQLRNTHEAPYSAIT